MAIVNTETKLTSCCEEKTAYWGASLICQGCFGEVERGA